VPRNGRLSKQKEKGIAMYRFYYIYKRAAAGKLEAVFEACAASAEQALKAYKEYFGDTSGVIAVIPTSPKEIALSDN